MYVPKEGYVQCERCEKWFHPHEIGSHMDNHSTKILDWLYLGGERNSSNYTELTKRTQIKYILNTANECHNHFPEEFVYHKVAGEDHVNYKIDEHFDACIDFIKKA